MSFNCLVLEMFDIFVIGNIYQKSILIISYSCMFSLNKLLVLCSIQICYETLLNVHGVLLNDVCKIT